MKRFLIFVLVALLSAAGWGAMTRNDICVEQNRFFQATTMSEGLLTFRGASIWMPYDYDKNIWQAWMLRDHKADGGTVDNVQCWGISGHIRAKFYAGTYIPCVYAAATYGRPAELGFKNVAGDTDGAWSDWNSRRLDTTSTYWHAAYRAASDRYVQVTVPANTTRLYMYAMPMANSKCDVAVKSGSATLIKSQLDLQAGGDFGTDHTGRLDNNWCLVATNCGGAVIKFTRWSTGGTLSICGWVAINDNATAQPDTGVFDPSTVVYLSAEALLTAPDAVGPLFLRFGAGSAFLWGMGHWTATNTLTSETETKILYNTISASDQLTWTNEHLADNTWVRTKGYKFTKQLKGDITVKNGAADAVAVGSYTEIMEFTASGLDITILYTFDSDVTDTTLTLAGGSGGGYAGKWNIPSSMIYGRYAEDAKWSSLVGDYSANTRIIDGYSTHLFTYSPSLDCIFDFKCNSTCINAAETNEQSSLYVLLPTGGTYPKVYKTITGSTDIELSNGDSLRATQTRRCYPAVGKIKQGTLGPQLYDTLGNQQ